jgi:DNA-binding MarR family transcriptional regulator
VEDRSPAGRLPEGRLARGWFVVIRRPDRGITAGYEPPPREDHPMDTVGGRSDGRQEHGADVLRFVEEVAITFEGLGLVRMAGRVIGWLLICEPREQTFTQVAEALQASRGTISSALKALVAAGWVERGPVEGRRGDRFTLRPGRWAELSRAHNAYSAAMTGLAAQGLELLADAPPARLDRLREMHDFHIWLDRELPSLWERWSASRAQPSG